MNFEEFIGQKEIITSIKKSLGNNRTGHAYIFNGPKGIGKKTLAKIFGFRLICENNNKVERCGTCPPCRMADNGYNPDFHIVWHQDESIGVEEIRKLQSDIMIKPVYSNKKVYLIIDADRMTIQAQNCLLKVLEEPPSYAVFILTTAKYDALLGTIRSRSIRFNFKKNTFSEVETALEQKHHGGNNGHAFIISYADGVIGTALELAESEEFASIREQVTNIVFRLTKAELLDIFEVYDFFEANKNRVELVFDIMLLLYRDLMIIKRVGKENILINSDKRDIILNNVSNFSMESLFRNIELIEKTRLNIKQNANYQLSIEVMLMKLQEDAIHGQGSWGKI